MPNIQKQIIDETRPKMPYTPPGQVFQSQQIPEEQFPQYPYQTGPQIGQPPRGAQQPQKPLVDLQVYPPPRPTQARKEVLPPLFVPAQSTGPYFPPQMNPFWPYYYQPNQMPIIKQYNINVEGPLADHNKLSMIYEDILPSKQFTNTSNTLSERLNIYNFVRSVFIKQYDGEDINLDGGGNNSSLMSYLKFMDLNPYNKAVYTDNPYKGLPDDMLIYRSCYPIRYDKMSNTTQCAPNSIGMNIRIYKLTHAEYSIKKNKENFSNYNVWREVAFYEYVREHILKRKVCPNFPFLYGYYICEQCNIDFDKLKMIKGGVKNKPSFFGTQQNTLQNLVLKSGQGAPRGYNPLDLDPTTGTKPTTGATGISAVAPAIGATGMSAVDYYSQIPLNKKGYVTEILSNDITYSGRGLVALTEAPTYNLYGWTARTYKIDGNVKRMVNTGYHKSEVWLSVLFQMMVAMYVLQLHKIVINKFNPEDNVFVKDTSQHENITTYWKYRVDNLDYYVPNYGHIVMVDSNFRDVEPLDYTLITDLTKNKCKKIYSNIFKENEYDDKKLYELSFDAFIQTINPNVFAKAFTITNGSKLPDDILSLIQKIYSDATSPSAEQNIGHYIHKYMGRLLNNRVGNFLTEAETKNIRKDDQKEFIKGQIVVYQTQFETYKFVVFMGYTTSSVPVTGAVAGAVASVQNNQAKILTKQDPKKNDIIDELVPVGSLFNYSRYENIIQDYKPTEAILNEDDLLETYTIGV